MKYDVIVSEEVKAALSAGTPVIAIESALLTHGMPYPENVKTILASKRVAQRHGAVVAVCAILNGEMHAGLSDEQIDRLGKLGRNIAKVSRRDIPFVMARGEDGATTVAGTMIIAQRAGIKYLATGGIGGVQRSADKTMDISADLTELGRTPIAVFCAGTKNMFDTRKTFEYLETEGVPVIAFRSAYIPEFFTPGKEVHAPCRADSVEDIARICRAVDELKLGSGIVITNPIPDKFAPDPDMMEKAMQRARKDAEKLHIEGGELTPYLFQRLAELTDGESLQANIAILYNNVRLAALTASQLTKKI